MRQVRHDRAPVIAALLVGALALACGHRHAAAPTRAPAIAATTTTTTVKVSMEEARALPVGAYSGRDGRDICGPYFDGPYPGVLRILATGLPDDPTRPPPRGIGAPLSPEFIEHDHWF